MEMVEKPPNRNGIERVERLRVSDSVAAQLVQLISKGTYTVGETLPSERVLAEDFGVSRSSMREAVRSIEATGMLSSSHGVGVFVTSASSTPSDQSNILVFDDFTVPELFEVRRMIEPDSARLAAQRATPAKASELQNILELCADAELPDEEFVKLDVKLHQTIADICRNGLLASLYSSLEPLLTEYSHRVIALPGRRAHAHEGHTKIVEAIIAGKARQAHSAGLEHIRDVERDIANVLAQPAGAGQRAPEEVHQ